MMFGEDFDLGSTQSSMWSFVKTVGMFGRCSLWKKYALFLLHGTCVVEAY